MRSLEVWGTARLVLIAAGTFLSCSTSHDPAGPEARDETAANGALSLVDVPSASVGLDALSDIRNRYELGRVSLPTPTLPESLVDQVTTEGGQLRLHLRSAATRTGRARVTLPARGDGAFRLADRKTDVAIEVLMDGSEPVDAKLVDGFVVYPGAMATALRSRGGSGGHVLYRVHPSGTEDFVTIDEAPHEPEITYQVKLGEKVAGLRVVSNVVEFVDARNIARLRVNSPYLVDGEGRRHDAQLSVRGCAFEDHAGRKPVGPGADQCTIAVTWAKQGIAYPALLDPGWSTTEVMSTPRSGHSATLTTCQGYPCVLVVGGLSSATTVLASSEGYLFDYDAWQQGPTMTSAKALHTATSIGSSGDVLVAGGIASVTNASSTTRIYRAATNTWANQGVLKQARWGHAAVKLAGGEVMVLGGRSSETTFSELATAEVIDASTGIWTQLAATMTTARYAHYAQRVSNNNVLVVVGGRNSGPLASAERLVYTASTKTGVWYAQNPIPEPIAYPAGVKTGTSTGIIAYLGDAYRLRENGGGDITWTDLSAGSDTYSQGSQGTQIGGLLLFVGTSTGSQLLQESPDKWFDAGAVYPATGRTLTTIDTQRALLVGGKGVTSYYTTSYVFGPRSDQGAACEVDGDCSNLQCRDGFCCDSDCQAICTSCSGADTGQANGTCAPATDGTDPKSQCTEAAVCGLDGLCDGAGACRYWEGVTCGLSECSGSTITPRECDGQGSCVLGAQDSCAPYVCDSTTECKTSCVTPTDCVAGYYCSAGACISQSGGGEPCTNPSQCSNGLCVDGYCCDTVCNQQCEACNAFGKEGTCSPVLDEPVGTRPPCKGAGTGCQGSCDGSKRDGCSYPGAAQACGSPTCNGGDRTEYRCDGDGACVSGTVTSCFPYESCANPSSCESSCSGDSQCADTYHCDVGLGACALDLELAAPCTRSAECKSGFCADGVCCNGACNLQCQACNIDQNVGDCIAKVGDPAPGRPSCKGVGTPCEGSCDGNKVDGCTYPGNSQSCGSATCTGHELTGSLCNGDGACVAGSTSSCFPYENCADGTSCDSSCVGDGQCVENHHCNFSTEICEPDLNNKAECERNEQCLSKFCIDGICCATACDGQCEACDVEGSEGICTVVPADEAPHGDRPPCTGGSDPACAGACDGASRALCSYPNDAVMCGDSRCEGNVLQLWTCDGQGVCASRGSNDCGAYRCNLDVIDCNSSCQSTEDCASGATCNPATGECSIGQATCKDAFTVVESDGSETSCRPYKCSAGVCRENCDDENDCVDGYDCVDAQCVKRPGGADAGNSGAAGSSSQGNVTQDEGCGCRAAPKQTHQGWILGVLLALAGVLRRRSRLL